MIPLKKPVPQNPCPSLAQSQEQNLADGHSAPASVLRRSSHYSHYHKMYPGQSGSQPSQQRRGNEPSKVDERSSRQSSHHRTKISRQAIITTPDLGPRRHVAAVEQSRSQPSHHCPGNEAGQADERSSGHSVLSGGSHCSDSHHPTRISRQAIITASDLGQLRHVKHANTRVSSQSDGSIHSQQSRSQPSQRRRGNEVSHTALETGSCSLPTKEPAQTPTSRQTSSDRTLHPDDGLSGVCQKSAPQRDSQQYHKAQRHQSKLKKFMEEHEHITTVNDINNHFSKIKKVCTYDALVLLFVSRLSMVVA